MAVIGARPATGPWILGRGGRPRPRTRPRSRSGAGGGALRRLGAGRRRVERIDIRAALLAIVAAAGLGFFYLSQSSHVAATGYEIDQLEAQLAERVAEQQQLILEIGHARSPAEIARRARAELNLVPLEDEAIRFAPSQNDSDD